MNKFKTLLIISILCISFNAYAVEIIPVKPSFFEKIVRTVSICKWNVKCYFTHKLGTTVTDISTATKFSDFPAIENANNLALNNGKIEVSTTTLPLITTLTGLTSVGALSSGSLTTGFTAVPVALNGTGTTSPTLNQLILGNGASGLKVIGFGTSGQFFTSAGADTVPSWTTSAVDQTDDYNWTGTHLFTDLQASSTVTLNGVALSFPSSLPSASSTMVIGSSGLIAYGAPQATSTIFTASGTWTRPAGVSQVHVRVVGGGGGGGDIGTGSGAGAAGGGGAGGYAEADVTVSGNVTVTVGSAGAASGNGGNSSFAGDVTVTANGGTGGTDNAGADATSAGGAGGSTTNADVGITGQSGTTGWASGAIRISGDGGSNPLGQGAVPVTIADANGNVGTGYGAGGSGASDSTTAARTGGVGTAGIVIVSWYQ